MSFPRYHLTLPVQPCLDARGKTKEHAPHINEELEHSELERLAVSYWFCQGYPEQPLALINFDPRFVDRGVFP